MNASSGSAGVDGRQLRWERHKAERRQRIVDAALEVLLEHPAGEDIHVHQIAERAGLNRTVVHRHFKDRADLDLAVQREIADQATGVFMGALSLDRTPYDIVHGIVDAFVRWAVDHLPWVRFVQRGVPGVAVRPIDEAIAEVVGQLQSVIAEVATIVGAEELSDDDRDVLDPWVSGLLGGGIAMLQRWMAREPLRPGIEAVIEVIADTSFAQIEVLARKRRLPLPEQSVAELISRFADDA